MMLYEPMKRKYMSNILIVPLYDVQLYFCFLLMLIALHNNLFLSYDDCKPFSEFWLFEGSLQCVPSSCLPLVFKSNFVLTP